VTPISLSDYTSIAITFKDSINSTPSTITYNLTTDDFGGGNGNDWIAATKNTLTNSTGSILTGLAGNDFIWGGAGKDYLNGGSGDDILVGAKGDDTLVGGSGNDTYVINNGSGADRIIDESGTDTLLFKTYCNPGFSDDFLTYRDGTSIFWRNYSDEQTYDTGEIKNFTTSGWIEKIKYVDGYLRSNYTYTYNLINSDSGTSGNDSMCSKPTGSSLTGLKGDDILFGFTGNDTLNGGDGNDYLPGHSGDDYLIGGAGNDNLYGEDGNDTLIGGLGKDKFEGGNGSNLFVFQTIKDSGATATTADLIEDNIDRGGGLNDFTVGNDRIDLSAIDANLKTSGNQAFNFSGTTATKNSAWVSYDSSLYTGGSSLLWVENSGDTTADMCIVIVGVDLRSEPAANWLVL